MRYLLTEIIEAESCKAVDSIVAKNLLDIPGCQRASLLQFARHRKEHIIRLSLLKKESWKEAMN
jgi:hypothetical protein